MLNRNQLEGLVQDALRKEVVRRAESFYRSYTALRKVINRIDSNTVVYKDRFEVNITMKEWLALGPFSRSIYSGRKIHCFSLNIFDKEIDEQRVWVKLT